MDQILLDPKDMNPEELTEKEVLRIQTTFSQEPIELVRVDGNEVRDMLRSRNHYVQICKDQLRDCSRSLEEYSDLKEEHGLLLRAMAGVENPKPMPVASFVAAVFVASAGLFGLFRLFLWSCGV